MKQGTHKARGVIRLMAAAGVVAAAALLGACATTGGLQSAWFVGSRLSARMPLPPTPRVELHYDLTLDSRRPVLSALSVLTNMAKAAQADKADRAMRLALRDVDVPGIVLGESAARCADALGAVTVDAREPADYALVLEITDWGIREDSPYAAVTLHLAVNARLVRTLDNETVWQRNTTVDEPASPDVFGLGQVMHTMVTATVLSTVQPEELTAGFSRMAEGAGRQVARVLQRDLDRARRW
jgi:hypothetical protein